MQSKLLFGVAIAGIILIIGLIALGSIMSGKEPTVNESFAVMETSYKVANGPQDTILDETALSSEDTPEMDGKKGG